MSRKSSSKAKGCGKSARRRAREYALQGLYEWLISNSSVEDVDAAVRQVPDYERVDEEFYKELFHGIVEQFVDLEKIYEPHIDRDIQKLSPIERAILLIGTYELKNTVTPYKVIINEAVELAKSFGGTEGFRYVNGVLDKLVAEYRPYEDRDEPEPSKKG
ncbi:MAG: transcription antitermination factor NusB [Burkholderiales bacterium]|nr:transcription antitermination factor NusB [Burkholderiales bacterium]